MKILFEGLFVLVIMLGGAFAGLDRAYAQSAQDGFTISIDPAFFHLAPAAASVGGQSASMGEGRNITVTVNRAQGFSGEVDIALVRPPSWVTAPPIIIGSKYTNGTLLVVAAPSAPLGSVILTVMASTTPGGVAVQTAQLSLKIVTAQKLEVSDGWAMVYDTTKSLDAGSLRALASYSAGNFTFTQSTKLLQGLEQGDVMGVPPGSSKAFPQGGLRLVAAIQQGTSQGPIGSNLTIVQTRQARLLDAVQQLQLVSNSSALTAPGLKVNAAGLGPDGSISIVPSKTWGTDLIDLGNGTTMQASLTYSLNFDFALSTGWGGTIFGVSCICIPYVQTFYVLVDGNEEANAHFTSGALPTTLSWNNDSLASLFSNTDIQILPGLLWLDINGDLVGDASGHLDQNVNVGIDQHVAVSVGPYYTHGSGWTFVHTFTNTFTKTFSIGLGDGSNARISLGPRITVLVDSVAGPYIEGQIFIELDSKIPHNPTWWLDGGVNISGGVAAEIDFWGLYTWSDSYQFASSDVLRFNILNSPDYPQTLSLACPVPLTFPNHTCTLNMSSPPSSGGFMFNVTASDPEGDTTACSNGNQPVTWASNVEQLTNVAPGASSGRGDPCTPTFKFFVAGPQQVTVVVTDSAGMTASIVVNINVINVPSVSNTRTLTVATAQAPGTQLNPLLLAGIVAAGVAVALGFAAVHILRKPPTG